jgi:hypothetical protein
MSGRFMDDFDARPFWAGFVTFGALEPLLLFGALALLGGEPTKWHALVFLGAVVALGGLMALRGRRGRHAAAGLLTAYVLVHLASSGVCTLGATPGTQGNALFAAVLFLAVAVVLRFASWARE